MKSLRIVLSLLACCLIGVAVAVSVSVAQNNHEKINAALETEMSPKDLQTMIATMQHLDETLVTLKPTTLEEVISRLPNPDKLFHTLTPETLEIIFSRLPSAINKQINLSRQKLADSWSEDKKNHDYKEEPEYPFSDVQKPNEHHIPNQYYLSGNMYPYAPPNIFGEQHYGFQGVPGGQMAGQFFHQQTPGFFYPSQSYQYQHQGYHLVDNLSPSVRHTILKYMPNIPDDLADALFYLDSGFVSYIINRHETLPSFMTQMHPTTIKYIMSCVNELPHLVAQMEPSTIEKIFSGVENICEYLVSKLSDATSIKTIVEKVPSLHRCVPQLDLDQSATTTSINTTPASTLKERVLKHARFYTREDAEKASVSIPRIREILTLIDQKNLGKIYELLPSIIEHVKRLNLDPIDFLNKNVDVVIRLLKNLDEESLKNFSSYKFDGQLMGILKGFL
ncbi:hypothetical protein Aperf_G00000000840 [Anoplocephala perfoliata]